MVVRKSSLISFFILSTKSVLTNVLILVSSYLLVLLSVILRVNVGKTKLRHDMSYIWQAEIMWTGNPFQRAGVAALKALSRPGLTLYLTLLVRHTSRERSH